MTAETITLIEKYTKSSLKSVEDCIKHYPEAKKYQPLMKTRGELKQILQALASLQAPPGEFTQGFRKLIELSKNHPSRQKVGRLQTKGLEACGHLDRLEAENKLLKEALEMKSYDLLIPDYYEKGVNATACSICGQNPHREDCKYGQALKG